LAWSRVRAWRIVVLAALVLALGLTPTTGVAQECTDCVRYAATELNLRQDPTLEAPVLGIVPEGSPVQLDVGDEANGYVPVTYDGVEGWVIAEGLAAPPEEIGVGAASTAAPAAAPAAAAPAAPAASNADARVTLAPLLLRSGPSTEADPILEMPDGAVVTLTREGAENGYVTVEFDGVIGWAYAELLGEPTSGD
jgi:N-acetylmuramoyl-L-alanine amidase